MTTTIPCDHCAGSGMEPVILGMDGQPIDPPLPCRSCCGQCHVEVDAPEVPEMGRVIPDVGIEWVHPEPSDKEMLDWLEVRSASVICNYSAPPHGWQVEIDGPEFNGVDVYTGPTARKAIIASMRAGK